MAVRDQDKVVAWVGARIEPAPAEWLSAADLYADYMRWAKAQRIFVVSSRTFSLALQTLPQLTKRLHSRSRRSGFVGARLRG